MPGHFRISARHRLVAFIVVVMFGAAARAGAGPVLGFLEDWPGTSTQGWGGGPSHIVLSNPGTGGVGGASDGYLLATLSGTPNFLGTRSNGAEYTGDWTAAGIRSVKVWLNDVGTSNGFEIHFCIGNIGNFWQYNPGFIPPSDAWSAFVVDLQDSTAFTHIIANDGFGFAWALQHTTTILLRHDFAPYSMEPDPTSGDLGIDHLELLGATGAVDGRRPLSGPALMIRPPQPNPSRRAVALAIETADPAEISIEIVDIQGRLVRRAVLPGGSAGVRSWLWDGRDESGRRVAAGSYRVRAVGRSGRVSRSLVRL